MKNKLKDNSNNNNTELYNIIFLCLSVTAVLFILWTFSGQWPWKYQPYNSYILQAQSWLKGRLDLEQNYSHLEIAVFNNKYFISFPPFPSYVMLPFVLFGWNVCDGTIAFAVSLAGAVYAYKILSHFNIDGKKAVFFSLFLTVASNWLMTAQNAWVWFIAQNMSFTLSLMAIYYALKNKAGLSLAFWACAVGCRPLQAVYIPVLLYILYKSHKSENPEDKPANIIRKRYKALIPMLIIALSYMLLNYMKFGNIAEFGHNYLAEHLESEKGQFNVSYILNNLKCIISLPEVSDGRFLYPAFNGMCMFMVSPITTAFIIYIVRTFITKTKTDNKFIILITAATVIEILFITSHSTMGGSHFGNRYTNDILPYIFLGLAAMLPQKDSDIYEYICYPLFFMGFSLNVIGTAIYFIGY